ncbi:hypothetical protein [Shewanella fidelis]|uniref:Uncharacterized protein n=1 Tax=Shewanella fidelis TaxID=173509 RepID=A0AAW8NI74_9GAMM|nr:hypothetical protein [Shewanella fidelis]MDR8522216.1 hypothetical protein [Shewanella fidelis]MDW4812568.1 hypothetical protein [Shewanella fidelis]MDW4816316.1 hypothetical protein [Shewanella fidelis]MDW4820809.1 hypothetical protein [Shewanella fidelis]MDW4825032.1 hypothetical protein [Shewanella fidelis]
MAKQLAHWVLFISLLGQFLLSPAMALPDQLHRLEPHFLQQLELHLQQPMLSLAAEADFTATPVLINDVSGVNSDASLFSLMLEISEQIGQRLCEASCQILSSGHCTSHSSCVLGLAAMAILFLKQDIGQSLIDGPSWSIKTVKLHVVTPPPNL